MGDGAQEFSVCKTQNTRGASGEERKALRNVVERPLYPLQGVSEIKAEVRSYLDMMLWFMEMSLD